MFYTAEDMLGLNISETKLDSGMVPMDTGQPIGSAHGPSFGHAPNDVSRHVTR